MSGLSEIEEAENFMNALQGVERHAELLNAYHRTLDSTLPAQARAEILVLYARMLYSQLLGADDED